MKKHRNDNADRHLCRTCKYRASDTNSKNGCDYIEIMGHSRGCSVTGCDKYEKGKRIKINTHAMDVGMIWGEK